MNNYRKIQWKVINETHILFFNPAAVTMSRGEDGSMQVDSNGERYRIIPEKFLNNPSNFAKLAIDTAYHNMRLSEKEEEMYADIKFLK